MPRCRLELRRPGLLLGTALALAGAPGPEATVRVTAPVPVDPLEQVLDPRRPGPGDDAAERLRDLPGFAAVRKGAAGADLVLRGLAGSRIGLLADGGETPGGCGGRMDPPSAYLDPGSFDRLVVVKGPQSVCHGPGRSAGTVRFEHQAPAWGRPGWNLSGLWTCGSFGRQDQGLDLRGGGPGWYARLGCAGSRSGDYRAGGGRAVHSAFDRWRLDGALGWRPAPALRLEVQGGRSDGRAAYADRGMDGRAFLRHSLGLAMELQDPGGVLENVQIQAYGNTVDHVMDDGSLRPPAGPAVAARNPGRATLGGRVAAVVLAGDRTRWTLGADAQQSRHRVRRTSNQARIPLASLPRAEDAVLGHVGLFAEADRSLGEGARAVAGLRVDRVSLRDLRPGSEAGPGAGRRRLHLASGFLRREWPLGARGACFAGLGQVRRAPDFWEMIPPEGEAGPSAFGLRPERATQADLGAAGAAGPWSWRLAGFFGRTADFILIQSGVVRAERRVTVARNIQAQLWGGELEWARAGLGPWRVEGSLAWARGDNRTDRVPLAQVPPLEGRIGLGWAALGWSAGTRARLVAPQDRIAPGQGSIAGQDRTRTPGFAVLSLQGGWQGRGRWLRAGVDNLFDRDYAEALGRPAQPVPGYPAMDRVPEPGRTVWVALGFTLP